MISDWLKKVKGEASPRADQTAPGSETDWEAERNFRKVVPTNEDASLRFFRACEPSSID